MTESLPDFVIAGLYPQSLVIIPEETVNHKTEDKGTDLTIAANKNIKEENAQEDVPFWSGGNLKHIVLIVKDPEHNYISDTNAEFLGKILAACHFNLEDVALVNIARTPRHFEIIQNKLRPQYLIFFQADLRDVGLQNDLKLYQPDRRNGCTFLLVSSLSMMNNATTAARQEKQRFWISLKQIFGIK